MCFLFFIDGGVGWVIVRAKLEKESREARNAKYLEKEKVVKVDKYYKTEVGDNIMKLD